MRGGGSGVAPFATLLGLMLAAMASLAVQDAMVKIVSDDVSIWQFNIVRSSLVLAMLGGYALVLRPADALRLPHPGWAVARAVLMVGAFVMFYGSLAFVSLSQGAATFFAAPLITAAIGMVAGRERVEGRRILALVAGFSGVLLIVKPWADDPELMLLLALCGAVGYGSANALTRLKLREDAALPVTAVQNVLYLPVALGVLALLDVFEPLRATDYPFLLTAWHEADALAWGLMVGTAITQAIGAILLTRVYQVGESSRVAPLEYVYLPMVVAIDLIVWGTVPGLPTLCGMVLIALGGVFVARTRTR